MQIKNEKENVSRMMGLNQNLQNMPMRMRKILILAGFESFI
jgi:hypothetical protein